MISRVIPPKLQKQGKMKKGITGVILFIAITFTSLSQTIINSGNVSGDWNNSDSPFLINGDITIPAGNKLSIAPGVEIIFQGDYTFTIIGRLDARGTANDSIIFTSADTTGFSTGTYNGWKGINFIGYTSTQTEKSILKYCKIEFSSSNGIFVMDFSNLEIDNCNVVNNLEFGISVNEFSDIYINDVIVSGNSAGGIGINSSNPVISGFKISNNYGSGISANGSGTITFNNGTITNNVSSSNGGGINIGMDANVVLENVEISGNTAINGGAINCLMGYITVSNSVITGNSSVNGAGINANYMASVSLDHVLVARNSADENGGALNIIEADLEIINSTIADNIALTGTGGLFLNNSSLRSATVTNSIFWNDAAAEMTIENELPEISYSDVQGGFFGEGNIDADPLFVNSGEGDYSLQWQNYPACDFTKSPCIDSGNPSLNYDPDGTTTDMGAFFFNQTSITAVDRYENYDEVIAYPNPATDIINIKGLKNIERVLITNLTGSIVKDSSVNGNLITMNISDLKPGIYLIVLYNRNGNVIKKKIVKR